MTTDDGDDTDDDDDGDGDGDGDDEDDDDNDHIQQFWLFRFPKGTRTRAPADKMPDSKTPAGKGKDGAARGPPLRSAAAAAPSGSAAAEDPERAWNREREAWRLLVEATEDRERRRRSRSPQRPKVIIVTAPNGETTTTIY